MLLIGVGDGLVPFYLKEVLGIKVTTCDIDPELQPDIVADVRNLPCADASYDAVAVFEVLEHLPFELLTGRLQMHVLKRPRYLVWKENSLLQIQ